MDLSYNRLKSLKYLSGLKYLVKVIAVNNELTSVFDTKKAPLHLDTLDVSSNKITKISDLSMHRHLRVLNLRANRISVIEGISKNAKLEILNLSENVIEEITGLEGLNLKELYVSNNQLETIKGMVKL